MTGDMIQDRWGSFFRNNGNGTADCFDTMPATTVPVTSIDDGRLLIRDGQPTGLGDRMAVRVADMLAKRYA